jgi:hypothetical protein
MDGALTHLNATCAWDTLWACAILVTVGSADDYTDGVLAVAAATATV